MSRAASICAALILVVACTSEPTVVSLPPPPSPPPAPPPPPPPGNHPPTAQITRPATAVEGAVLRFGTSGSGDPDGDSLTFVWNFGDGTTLVTADTGVAHPYGDNGTFQVTLIVRDEHNAADTAVTSMRVDNAAPEISISKFPEPVLPLGMVLEAEVGFWDMGSAERLQGRITWGDGTSTDLTSGMPVTHKYAMTGQYSVAVYVTDKDGASTGRLGPRVQIFDGYDVIDLGTLGGASSRAYAMNDKGDVVGTSQTVSGEWHAFVWKNGVMQDLGLPYLSSKAQAITNSGVISGIGTSQAEQERPRVFRWSAGTLTDLGPVYEFEGPDMRVVGMTGRDILATFETSMSRFYSTVWLDGVKRNLGGLESSTSTALATAMNSRGQIVGSSLMTGPAVRDIYHAFLWQDGSMHDLGVLQHFKCPETPGRDCGSAMATDLNTAGDVVGTSVDSFFHQHAVLWPSDGGPIRDLGPAWRAVAVNEAGEVAGYDLSGGVFYRQGVTTRLESLNGQMTVADLNDLSMVIGTSQGDYLRAHVFVWQPGQARLKDLGTGGTHKEALAVAINARGDIIGYSCSGGVFNNCPESASSRAILWRIKT
jgi:probable HAF family extracellular repeat protein